MTPLMARRLLVLAAEKIGTTMDGMKVEPSAIVQAVEIIFSTAVAFHPESGAVCPFCNRRCCISSTWQMPGAVKRYHKCPRCNRTFCSVQDVSSKTPDVVVQEVPPVHTRTRRRRR